MDKVAKTVAARSIYRDHLFKSPKFNCWTLELVRWLWSSDCSDTWPIFYPCKKLLLVLLKSHDWQEMKVALWKGLQISKLQTAHSWFFLIHTHIFTYNKYVHAYVWQILMKVSFFVCPFFGLLTLHCFYFGTIHFFLPRFEKTRAKSAHFLIFTVGFHLSRLHGI